MGEGPGKLPLLAAVRESQVGGAVLLLVAAAAAMIWANSPAAASYHALVATQVTVSAGGVGLSKPLIHWINEGLMGIFFFSVGLEIKREVLDGELSAARKAVMPVFTAIGGMVVPAAVYLVFNWDSRTTPGWGIPMATDIAFAVGVLSLFHQRVPAALFVFLAAVAIADDIGAILVIAFFYTDSVAFASLGLGAIFFALALFANRSGIQNPIVYFAIGLVVWLGFLQSGVHATLAAVLMAFTIPAKTRLHGRRLVGRIVAAIDGLRDAGVPADDGLLSKEQHEALAEVSSAAARGTTPLQQLERSLDPVVAFVVLPLFALANAGVPIDAGMADIAASPVTMGIFFGLVLGKQIGIFGFAWLSVKLRLADLPENVTLRQVHACAMLGGIGFTMALFIAGLAFSTPAHGNAAKVAILLASLIAGASGSLLLHRALPRRVLGEKRQSQETITSRRKGVE